MTLRHDRDGARLSHSQGDGRLKFRIGAVAICAALTIAASAQSQTLKSGALFLVVPFAPGGPSDVAGRILAAGMQEALGQNVVVENPVGGGGSVGSLRVS